MSKSAKKSDKIFIRNEQMTKEFAAPIPVGIGAHYISTHPELVARFQPRVVTHTYPTGHRLWGSESITSYSGIYPLPETLARAGLLLSTINT